VSPDESVPDAVLHHIGIATPADQHDEVVKRLLGIFRGTVEDDDIDVPLDIRGTWIRIPSGLILEVLSPCSDAPGPITRHLERTGGGLHHVSFETSAIGTCKELAAENARVIGECDDHSGWAEFFVDPAQTGRALLHWMQKV
jgi:methylmalonyl-CoA/ethylmalonyl-CoA epimerase